MYHPLSSRLRAEQLARRGRYLPHVDLLEDRLAPGDTVLSQVLGMSLLGSVLPGTEGLPLWNTTAHATFLGDIQLVQASEQTSEQPGLAAFDAAVAFEDQTVSSAAFALQGEETVSDSGEFLTSGIVDPMRDSIFGAASVASVARLRNVNVAAVQVGDGSFAGSFGGGSLIGTVAETPLVVAAANDGLNQATQFNAVAPQAALDPVVLEARDSAVPANYTPQLMDLSTLPQPAGDPRAEQFLAGFRAWQLGGGGATGPEGPGDPAAPGPLPVTPVEFNLGNVTLPGTPGPVEIQARVTFPTNLPGGPYPMVIFLHGRHATCFQGGSAFLEWPCAAGRSVIPSYQGYDYIAPILASHGYIVASIGANGVNARDNSVADLGMLWRAQLIQRHLDNWNTWNTSGGGPAGIGNSFIGKVDLQNVGTMGHSRGGEGVVRHFVYNQSLGSPYGITAVFPLAPVDFSRPIVNAAHQAVLLPYCDGDVSDLQGMHFFDDARFNMANNDLYYKSTITVMGANHNFFNTVWTPGIGPAGAADDWASFVGGAAANPQCGTVAGNGRLTSAQQRATGLAYIAGFFRTFQGLEFNLAQYYLGDGGFPEAFPPTTRTFDVRVSSHSPLTLDTPGDYRRDVNRLLSAANLTTNTLGGAVTQSGLVTYEVCGGVAPQAQHCIPTEGTGRQPHTVPSARDPNPARRALSQVRLVWNSPTAFWQNDLPAGSRDVSSFSALAFRAGVNFADTARNVVNGVQDFSVQLTDGGGNSASVPVSWFSNALWYPFGLGGTPQAAPVPKLILNSIRIPLGAYTGINLTDVRSIRFNFNQTTQGHILLTETFFTLY